MVIQVPEKEKLFKNNDINHSILTKYSNQLTWLWFKIIDALKKLDLHSLEAEHIICGWYRCIDILIAWHDQLLKIKIPIINDEQEDQYITHMHTVYIDILIKLYMAIIDSWKETSSWNLGLETLSTLLNSVSLLNSSLLNTKSIHQQLINLQDVFDNIRNEYQDHFDTQYKSFEVVRYLNMGR